MTSREPKPRPKARRMWGGFSGGELDTWPVTDVYGTYLRVAVFTNRRDARRQYHDVRCIEIKEIK